MNGVPPCPRCGELDLVSRDGGCGQCGWYEGSGDPAPAPVWWLLLIMGVTVVVIVLLALALLDPH